MPTKIQRVPQGLLPLLGAFGGETPPVLADQVLATVDILQLYGLTQVQRQFASNGALAEGGSLAITLTSWCVLFGANFNITKTATMTALSANITIFRGGAAAGPNGWQVAFGQFSPFGATETGGVVVPWVAPYPLLCPPGTGINGSPLIIGTDATAACSLTVEIGLLG